MFFLVRMAFWFALVLLVLPLDAGRAPGSPPAVSPLEAISAARAAIGDVAGLCERQPDVCVTGKAAFQTIGTRARESARIAYELLDENFGETTAAAADATVTDETRPDETSTGSVPALEVIVPATPQPRPAN